MPNFTRIYEKDKVEYLLSHCDRMVIYRLRPVNLTIGLSIILLRI